MKILIKECKKIMDIRVLLVIAVFTVLFYQLFLEVTIYPAGGQTTDSPYDMPFYAELIESWGTSLPREDWSKLDEKRKELEEAYTRIIAADPVLADAKITNYQEFSKTQETFFDKDTLTDEEKKIDQELSRLVFEDSKGSKLFFELQVLDRLDEYKNLQKGDSISLMPGGIFYIVEKDMRMMGILLLICFAILALPYLIRERLCHVLPLYATTATGRKLFDRQFQALVACCGFVGIVQFGRTVARDISSCLRPRCRPGRVGMHDTANIRETVVKYHVGRRIGRRVVLALDLIALQIHNNHIFRCQFVIIYTARLDYKKSCLPVDTTDIAPGKCHQLIFWQKHICLINFSF